MKTNRITVIATVLALAASSSLWAAPPGKHAVEKIPHRHGAVQGATHTGTNHTMLNRVGPPGKNILRSSSNSR